MTQRGLYPKLLLINRFYIGWGCKKKKNSYLCTRCCPDGEMVDALVSGASAERRVGSSPILGTKKGVFELLFVFILLNQPVGENEFDDPLVKVYRCDKLLNGRHKVSLTLNLNLKEGV